MTYKHGEDHVLEIFRYDNEPDADPDDVYVDYEISHHETCKHHVERLGSSGAIDFVMESWLCNVGAVLAHVGLDELDVTTFDSSLNSWRDLPSGKYVMTSWSNHREVYEEWDVGLVLLGKVE